MENTHRLTGYGVALALLGSLLYLVLTLREGVLFPHHRVQVRFESIGTLMIDDPVKEHGVEIGRVARIESGGATPIATLELYHRNRLPKDSRFINYNYSMFGARMVVVVTGVSKEKMDPNVVQQGDFSSGVTETIHRVDGLLKTVIQYRDLTRRLQVGNDSTRSMQQVLANSVYPALEEYGRFARDLETLRLESDAGLDKLAMVGAQVNSMGKSISVGSDTLVLRANRTLAKLTVLSAQSEILLHGLEEILVAAQDSTRGPGRLLVQRDSYDRAMAMTHALEDLLKLIRKEGVQDMIHFWRNVHIHYRSPRRN